MKWNWGSDEIHDIKSWDGWLLISPTVFSCTTAAQPTAIFSASTNRYTTYQLELFIYLVSFSATFCPAQASAANTVPLMKHEGAVWLSASAKSQLCQDRRDEAGLISLSYPEEERKLPAIEAHSEELWFNPLLLDDVVIVRCLHFLSHNDKHAKESWWIMI